MNYLLTNAKSNCLQLVFLFLGFFGFIHIGAAQVVAVSPDKFVQVGVNEAYWEVVVECAANIKPSRVIRQNHNENRWCSKEFRGVCGVDKASASQLICGAEHSARLNAQNQERIREQQQRQLAERRQQDAEAKRKEAEAARVAQQRRVEQERASRQQANAQARQLANTTLAEDELIDIEQQLLQLQTAQLENRKKLRAIRKELARR